VQLETWVESSTSLALRSVAVPIDLGMDTFVEVSQIAHEAVRDAMPQPPAEVPTPLVTTTDVIAVDASMV